MKKILALAIISLFLFSIASSTSAHSISHRNAEKTLLSNPIFELNQPRQNDVIDRKTSSYKILFDQGHNQYFDSSKLSDFISMIEEYFGDVTINTDNITSDDLNGVNLLIIPSPEANISQSEITAIKTYLENGGSLLIMGTWYKYFEPEDVNAITGDYGITWGDYSIYDDTDNDGNSYHPLVHVWDTNNIANEIGTTEYISQVIYSGTALFLKAPTSGKVEEGPYFIGIPDSDTYLIAENGSAYVQGVNLTASFGFFAAAKLVNGGKIFASGSTETFRSDSDPQRNYFSMYDNKRFALIVVAWLLGVSPESVLQPIITNVSYTETYRPNIEGFFNFTIENIVNIAKENTSVMVYVPYFLSVYDKVTIERNTGKTEVNYTPGTPISLGELQGLEKVNISIPLIGIMGNEGSDLISVYLYISGSLITLKKYTIYSEPAFELSAEFKPFYINVSKVNYSYMYINVTNRVDYTIENITITLTDMPNGVKVNASEMKIDSLAPGNSKIITIKAGVPTIGVYEFPMIVRDPYGSEAVRRPFLLAITQKLLVFDEGHNQYVRSASPYMQGLIGILKDYGPVLINKGEFPASLLDPQVTALIVIPTPQPPGGSPTDTTSEIFTDTELEALQNYVEFGGSLLLMGNYYTYFWPDNPNSLNDLTTKFGIYWYDGDIYDNVNNFGNRNYNVILKNFANNSVAKFLSSGVDAVYYAGTGLKLVQPEEETTKVYPVLLGNNESYLTLGSSTATVVVNGTDCILVAVAETQLGGRIIAAGSYYMFSDYYYFSDNVDFIRNMISWLSKINKMILDISPVPAALNLGQPVYITIKVRNTGVQTIYNVKVEIAFSPGIKLENASSTVDIGDLEPGAYKIFVLKFTSKSVGAYIVTISAYGDNYPKISQKIILNFVKQGGGAASTLIWGAAIGILVIIGIAVYWFKFIKKREA